MSLNTEPRFRISAKQTAKNYWQLDATVEYKSETIEISTTEGDKGNTIHSTLGLRLLSVIHEAEKAFREDGRKIVGDSDGN